MKQNAEHSPHGLLEHYLSQGVYVRVLNISKDHVVVGQVHTTTHISIVLSGEMTIKIDDAPTIHVKAPYIFESKKGSRKIAYGVTNCSIANIILTTADNVPDILEEAIDTTEPDADTKLRLLGMAKEVVREILTKQNRVCPQLEHTEKLELKDK